MKRLLLIIIATLCFTSLSMGVPGHVSAALFGGSSGEACKGVTLDKDGKCDAQSSSQVDTAIRFAVNIFTLVVGVAAVIMIIVGGLKYITSGGDASNTASAKNTILYAIIGLIIVVLAQVLVRFVIKNSTSKPKAVLLNQNVTLRQS